MCNLNILVKTDDYKKTRDSDFLNFYNSACYNSFVYNNDNEGFYFDYKNTLLTSDKKINLFDNKTLFYESNFILGHQRFSTSGFKIDYAQPFKKQDFVLLHNGVLSDYAKEGHSDTFNLFENFIKHFNRYEKQFKRDTAIKNAILKILKNKSGSYSIGIFDIKTKNLFYFKNSSTRINVNIHKNKKALYMTTEEENINFLNICDEDFNKFEIKDFSIYKINIKKNKISLNLCVTYKQEKTNPNSKKQYFDWQTNIFSLDDIKTQNLIKKTDKKNKCIICGKETHNTKDLTGWVYCDECLRENNGIRDEDKYIKYFT